MPRGADDRQASAMEKMADESKKQTRILEALNENLVTFIRKMGEPVELTELSEGNPPSPIIKSVPVHRFNRNEQIGLADMHFDGGISIYIDSNTLMDALDKTISLDQIIKFYIGVHLKETDGNA